ncbi:MAG: glutathione S-transferase N-terminal domain-containing protein [Alphaproteobacteria bacterium]
MKLRWAPASPFVRKVTVTALEIGIDSRIERVATDYHDPNSDIVEHNPLGKVPALIRDDGSVLVDSPVICAYLDSLGGDVKVIPPDGEARWQALQLEGLADGLLEQAIAVQRERGRPEDKRWQAATDRAWAKVERTLDWIEANPAMLEGTVDIGQIALGCALGWIEFRMGERLGDWRARWPAVGRWYDGFAQRPSMRATAPVAA